MIATHKLILISLSFNLLCFIIFTKFLHCSQCPDQVPGGDLPFTPPSPSIIYVNTTCTTASPVSPSSKSVRRYQYWHVDKTKPRLPDYGKYVTYNPYWGFNNQQIELQHAIYIAKILNRTLVLPNKIGIPIHQSKAAPIGRFWDLDDLGKMVSILDEEAWALRKEGGGPFFNKHIVREGTKSIVFTDRITPDMQEQFDNVERKGRKLVGLLDEYGDSDYHNLHFRSLWGMRDFFILPDTLREQLLSLTEDYLHYTDEIYKQAMRISEHLGSYSCTHIRATDITTVESIQEKPVDFIPRHIRSNERLYIATDSATPDVLSNAFSHKLGQERVFTWAEISFLFADLQEELEDNDYRGVLEQVTCILADQFFPTKGSTFSARIVKMRRLYQRSYYGEDFNEFP